MASRVSTPRKCPAPSTMGNSVWVVRISASAASATVAEVGSDWNSAPEDVVTPVRRQAEIVFDRPVNRR